MTVPEIETMQRAAALMRERAEKATDGPWDADGRDGLVWPPRLGDPISDSTEPDDAIHIAGWHPPVALAVAGWLDHEATRFGNVLPQWRREWAGDEAAIAALTDGLFRHPLAIARAYLRDGGPTHAK